MPRYNSLLGPMPERTVRVACLSGSAKESVRRPSVKTGHTNRPKLTTNTSPTGTFGVLTTVTTGTYCWYVLTSDTQTR
jgi:hypothetical protein